MKKAPYFLLLVLVLLVVVAYLTNPNEQQHQAAAKEKLHKVAENLLAKYGIEPGFIPGSAINFTDPFVDSLIEKHVSAHNYFLFSTTNIEWEGQSQIIGVGAFKNVFISPKADEMLQQELENYVKEKIRGFKIPGLEGLELGF